jgi:hypothetical protein
LRLAPHVLRTLGRALDAALLHPAWQDTRKRVVGILLGESHKGRLDVTNSYAGALPRLQLRSACGAARALALCAAVRATLTHPRLHTGMRPALRAPLAPAGRARTEHRRCARCA